MAVSRNLAINSLSSKLEPFIRGHDLPKCPRVDDDDADDYDVEVDVDVDYDTDYGDGVGDCVDADVCNLTVQFANVLCTYIAQDGKLAGHRIHETRNDATKC